MERIGLFHPYIPESAKERARETLDLQFIGQGPQVDEFELLWQEKISNPHKAIAVGSGTDALHLAYILAGVQQGDEVVSPVFTCSATNTPILYQGAKPVFADINPDNLNVSVEDVRKKITSKTKAIVAVDYGGLPADIEELQALAHEYGISFIEDAAQSQGAIYRGRKVGSIADFTCVSFQAIKLITTVDGGMLSIKNPDLEDKVKRIRWFGIDRRAKLEDRWKNDIWELGYKYQMTDVSASLGIEALKVFDETLAHHRKLFEAYRTGLAGIPGITFIGDDEVHRSSCWLATVLAENRDGLKAKLAENNIDSNQVHYRNDLYTLFGGRVSDCPNMDKLESKYLVLPMHYYVTEEQIAYICDVIRKGW